MYDAVLSVVADFILLDSYWFYDGGKKEEYDEIYVKWKMLGEGSSINTALLQNKSRWKDVGFVNYAWNDTIWQDVTIFGAGRDVL